MGAASDLVGAARARARKRRRELFVNAFQLGAETTVLDLGSDDGSHIHAVLEGTAVRPANVTIADIRAEPLERGQARYGFNACQLVEGGRLPFDDGHFDIVFSNSVIEHATGPKEHVWDISSGEEFRALAEQGQMQLAQEIRRIGRGYFVQTPNKWFLIESHSWMPGFGWLPRRALLPALRITNRFWIKDTNPDWLLLGASDMKDLFPDAEMLRERFGLFTKSLIAVKRPGGQ